MTYIICEASGKVKHYRVQNNKIRGTAVLQELDKPGANRRIYKKVFMEAAIRAIQDRIRERKFIGELDHPTSASPERLMTVLLSNASHVFTRVWIEGDKVFGEFETLSTDAGKNLSALIQDGFPVGFSVRCVANTEERGNYVYAKPPIFIISYDAVANPSFSEATVREVSMESATDILTENGIIPSLSSYDFPALSEIIRSIFLEKLIN